MTSSSPLPATGRVWVEAEKIAAFGAVLSAGLSAGARQALRGLGLGLLGFGVVLLVTAALIGITELGPVQTGPDLPSEVLQAG